MTSFFICFASYICNASYILADAKVIFRLVAEVKVNPQLAQGANITATQYHCRRQYHAEGISLLQRLLVKAERDHKSFVDLSHCAVGQIADFVF